MKDLARTIAGLSPEKQRLLIQQLRTRGIELERTLILPQPRDGGSLPASFTQQRLWFLQQLDPAGSAYNIPAAVRLRGGLDLDSFAQALGALMRRHEILRTSFVSEDGEPRQQIAAELAPPLRVVDLCAQTAERREAEVRRLMAEEAARPFDLAQPPLLRVLVIRLAASDHAVLVTLHHTIADGWSAGIFIRELALLYEALRQGQPDPLPPLGIQYPDYAVWQRGWLAGAELERQLAFWRERLDPAPPVLRLPTDRPRPHFQRGVGGQLPVVFAPELTAQLRRHSHKAGVTLFMALLAGFGALLQRYSGQEHFCIGVPIANRQRAELEGLIGALINSLALPLDLSGRPSFNQLLGRIRELTLGAFEHQDLPFELLVERLQPARDTSHAPFFQVLFSLQNTPVTALTAASLELQPIEVDFGAAALDLSLVVEETAEGLRGALEYNSDLFDAATVARMAGQLTRLLAAALAAPDQPLATLPLLDDAERALIVAGWNQTRYPHPTDRCIHQLIAAQAARTPDAVALIAGAAQLSYAELEARANQLAHLLRGRGVGAETLVGICLERSPELIIALLAILKAGGAYLPLDPELPAARRDQILADARPALILSAGAAFQRLAAELDQPKRPAPLLLELSGLAARIAAQPETPPTDTAQPEQLAYLIYTSGSTGQPKGVLVEHRAVVNHNQAVARAFALRPGERVLQFATISFDAAVEEIFPTLQAGAALVLRPGDAPLSPRELLELVAARRVSVLDLPTAYWHALTDELTLGGATLPPALRLVVVGGEAASAQALATWRRVAPGVAWMNTYGPTEATVIATWHLVAPHEPPPDAAPVPLGRPIDNVQIYVLDGEGQPTPIGVPGELCIGGAGVARGYLGRPELTAERFVADPFSAEAGARLYRTGDLARWRDDGTLEFIGRLDDQVKIRGFRVEPGEVGAILAQHPALRDALVLARTDAAGQPQLVAYVAPRELPGPPPAELRAFLQAQLPDYMLPGAYVSLVALPLTPSGKVDRRALPAPEGSDGLAVAAYVAPRGATEELLAAIFAELLGLARVGAHDDFFALGGHSLLATRLAARARERLGVELPLRAIFAAPTVAELAAQLGAGALGGAQHLPPIRPVGRDGALPLSSAQQRLWFLDQLEPGSPLYNIPAALHLRGQLDLAALEQSLSMIVQRHEVLRTTFATVDGRATQLISPPAPLTLAVEDLRQLDPAASAAEADRLSTEEARAPFDLARAPLFRARLLRLADDEHLALLTMHHSIADGWSMGVLIEELGALYAAAVSEREPALPALPVQYADYAVWQRDWLESEQFQHHLDYWRRRLEGCPPSLDLPTDRPRPAVASPQGGHYRFALSRALGERLGALAREEGATLFMALLAGLQVLLSRYSGQDDICVGTPVAGRTSAELEPLIGCFVNTLALRGDLSGTPSFRELLRQVRETTLDAYAHQSVPFELVVDAVQPERSLDRTPLFQVMFSMQNTPAAALALPGLELRAVEPELAIATFDLTLSLGEDEEGLSGGWEYRTDLFDEATIARLAGHFQLLLARLADDPDQRITAAPLLSAGERDVLIAGWNTTARPFPHTRCLHELVAAQAARTPAAIALVAGAQQLCYAELDAQANQLANLLRARGVGPGAIVALALARSPELLVAMLGVLKAGAAYLPLDSAAPAARLRLIIADARPAVLLSVTALAPELDAALADAPEATALICLDAAAVALAQQPTHAPAGGATADDPAYVIYTSGSTGTPKGVLVPHRAVVNHNQAVIRLFELSAADRVLQFNAITFDAAVEEIFPIWQCGGALVLRPAGPAPTGAELLALVEASGVTLLDLPTAYWHALVDELVERDLALPAGLRLVVVGGEAASAARLAAWQVRAGRQVTWINTYGPTEATVIAAAWALPAGAAPWAGPVVPIGRPLDNVQLYVLEASGEPAPVGVPGELHIGGAGIALGYLNRPELSAEKFVPDPFSVTPGARLYRTGDRARWRPDGQLEFLGRADDQVKLRGFRVEPGEVAAVIEQHPAVRAAAVVAREQAGALRLVAYVVPRDPATDEGVLAAALREQLSGQLPDYMQPAAFVRLEELPLTATGKLDRRALPAPAPAAPTAGADAPRTAAEATLAGIWAATLGLAEVGLHDNFFALGGDSILSIQVIARANQAGLRLTPRQLFEAPTIAALATLAGSTPAPLAEQGAVVGAAPLMPIQRWFLEQDLPAPHHWNQSLLLEVEQPLERPTLEQALDHLQAHHDALRLRLCGAGATATLAFAGPDEGPPARDLLRWHDLAALDRAAQAAARARLAAEAQASLDLVRGPIWRVAAFDLGVGQPAMLLIVIHHLAVDAVSWRILLEDLQTLYAQLCAGRPAQLPPKTTSLRQWAQRLAEQARAPETRAELAYWAAPPRGAPAPLPRDYPAGVNLESSAHHLTVTLDVAATRALLQEAPAAYNTTIDDALLTVLAMAIGRWTGSPGCMIAMEGHGREAPDDELDLTRTVGWFTTLFPLRLDLSGARDMGAALRAVKEQLRAVPRRGLGYGLLRYLSGDPDAAATLAALPEPEVSFNYLGQLDTAQTDEQRFSLAAADPGPERSSDAPREQVLEVTASVGAGCLRTTWSYSAQIHHEATIARLADDYLDTLRELIAHCRAPAAGGYTPSDFALAELDQRRLDRVIARIGTAKE